MTPDADGESARAALTQQIRDTATAAGFSLVGIAPAVSPPGYPHLLEWLGAGYAADMDWIERRKLAYETPAGVMRSTVSLIVCAMNYHEGTPHSDGARVSRYAWGSTDYHDLLRSRLQQVADVLHEARPPSRTRIVVDTAPVLERDFARLAGIGWFGKNTMLISRRIGSWFFLGSVLTDLELQYDKPHEADHCGT